MKTILIMNESGGVGKSQLCFHLSHFIPQTKRVLIINLDPQGDLSRWFGVGSCNAMYIYQSTPILRYDEISKNRFLVSCNRSFASVIKNYKSKTYAELYSLIKKTKGFDYCLIDAAGSMSLFDISAIIASDRLLIPVTLREKDLNNARAFHKSIEEYKSRYKLKIKLAGLVLNFFEKSKKNDIIAARLSEKYNVFSPYLKKSDAIETAIQKRVPVWKYRPKLEICSDYKKLLKNILQGV